MRDHMAPASAGRPDEAQEPRSKAVIELLCANPGAPRVSSHQIAASWDTLGAELVYADPLSLS